MITVELGAVCCLKHPAGHTTGPSLQTLILVGMTSSETTAQDAVARQPDKQMKQRTNRSAKPGVGSPTLPWSHRLNPVFGILVTALAGIASGVVGTFAHRMGASANMPYGLILAFVLIALSTWCARSRLGVAGLAVHLITSSGVIWMIAAQGTGDALTPIGFSGGAIPYFSQHVGYIWLIGCIVIQLLMLPMPDRWFTIAASTNGEADGSHHDTTVRS